MKGFELDPNSDEAKRQARRKKFNQNNEGEDE